MSGAENATERIEVRYTPQAKKRIIRAASLAGETPSDFIRRACEARAEQVFLDHQQMTVVPASFFDDLLAALDAPGERNDALTRAFQRARQVVEQARPATNEA